ncbi:MAG: DsbA family oxidoreductase [Chloroflexi bacterium]|nr:DsbA family oxidoreductase [Chloroflexota bacterium]
MRIEIWSDVICPWCYIGKHLFEHALQQFPHKEEVKVVYRSFQLDPYAPQRRTENFIDRFASKYDVSVEQAEAALATIEQAAAEARLEFHLAQTRSGNTADAHRILYLAKARGLQEPVIERFFRAYFTEGQSLFDHDSLVRLSAEAGLDPQEVRRVLKNNTYIEHIIADYAEAQNIGVSGVPFFIIDGRYAVSGAQPSELFTQAMDQAWSEPPLPSDPP